MPIRTSPDLKTLLSYTIVPNSISPLLYNNTYRIRVRPFNLSDYFRINKEDNFVNNDLSTNSFECTINNNYVNPISSPTYFLEPSSGVSFYWRYNSISKYKIIIHITDDNNSTDYSVDINKTSEFAEVDIEPSGGIVKFNIPDLNTNPLAYLTAGRSYSIGISAIKLIKQIDQSYINIYSDITYMYNIIPFKIPNRPIYVTAQGGNRKITLTILIPNIASDPNYYVTEAYQNYYKYKYILIEYKETDIQVITWKVQRTDVSQPAAQFETIQVVDIGGTFDIGGNIENDRFNYNIRVSMGIYNEYNNQVIYSNYTYPTVINNITYPELSGNIVYASIYPYKPSIITNLYVWKYSSLNNKLEMYWNAPSYNGNAKTYIYTIQYSTSSNPTAWYDIYDTINGIANQNDGDNYRGPIPNTADVNQQVSFLLTCKSKIQNYNIRIRVTGYIQTNTLNPTDAKKAISDYSSVTSIIL